MYDIGAPRLDVPAQAAEHTKIKLALFVVDHQFDATAVELRATRGLVRQGINGDRMPAPRQLLGQFNDLLLRSAITQTAVNNEYAH